MSDDNGTLFGGGGGDDDQIRPIDINDEMQSSYIDYAMSVIVGRALPEVRDGLKPVHRRILYAMYDNGYRPERGYVKSAKPVSDTMGNYHPHGDSAIYDTMVRMAQPWSMRYPLVDGQGNFGSRGDDGPAAMRYTEARLTPLAMEMVRDIRENTVDFQPNYDGRTTEPVILPSRVPQLLMNGSGGIAVGMATNIPPHNLREVAAAINWCLDNPDADDKTALEAVMSHIKGPDFPTAGQIVGDKGITDAYTTGRGSIRMRGVTSIEQEGNRQSIVITELPYQVNPDRLIANIAEQVRDGRLAGIASIDDESDLKWGMRIVVKLKRDAVPRVVLNNLYKHSQLQTSFGANMLSIVDGVPRTLRIDQMVRLYVDHQIEVIVRRTQYRLDEAEKKAHILRGLVKALDMLDEVIALIRRSATVDTARTGLMELLDIDEVQADAILAMQLRRLAALERQKIIDELAELEERIAEVLQIQTYQDSPYLVLATSEGKVKKSRLEEYDSARSAGLIAINLKEGDSLIGARLCSADDDLLLVSERGQAIRFTASDDALRPMGRATAGVLGMRFKGDDKLLSMVVVEEGQHLLVATTGGYGKKTPLDEYTAQGRGGQGVLTLKYDPKRGPLMGALVVSNDDEIFAVTSAGDIIRTRVNEIRATSRATKGVRLVNLADGTELLAIDRNVEDEGEETAVKVSETGTLDSVEARPGGVSASASDGGSDEGGEE